MGFLRHFGVAWRTVLLPAVAPKTYPAKTGQPAVKTKFTDGFIRGLKATGKPYGHGDSEHRGLMVRVAAAGRKVFALAYHSKADQKTRFLTIGEYPHVTTPSPHMRGAGDHQQT
jgi:hypothetical protein